MAHKYTVKDLPQSQKQITITAIDEKELEKAEKKVMNELSKEVKVKGFRDGHVPEKVIREQVQEAYILGRTAETALPAVLQDIAEKDKLQIIKEPKIEFKSLDPLEIEVVCDIYPELTLGDYKKIKVKVEKKKTSEKEVKTALEDLQERFAEFKKVERAAKKDDRAEIDFAGFTPDGVPLDNTVSKHHPVILGSNSLIPGFEDEVVGMKAGEEKEFEITFPKDYHSESMAGKKTKFQIKLHQVEERSLPKVDDAFVEKVTGKKQSVADFKKQLKDDIQAQHDANTKRETEDQYFEKLIAQMKGDVPQSMIDEEKQVIMGELKQRILRQGLSFERYLSTIGKTEEELLESYDKQGKERIVLQIALAKIAEKEEIGVSELEIEEGLNEMLERYPEDQRASIKQQSSEGSHLHRMLEHQIKMKKTLEKILPKG